MSALAANPVVLIGQEQPVQVLFVGPHPDDVELAAGGTIALLAQGGVRVGILDLTNGEPTPSGSVKQRLAEATAAARILGVTVRVCLNLPNRSLQADLESRWYLAGWLRRLRPSVVFLPHGEDIHPDHVHGVRLIEDASFWSKLSRSDIPGAPHPIRQLIYFACVHLRTVRSPDLLVDISNTMDRKLEALRCYRSQLDPEHRRGPVPTTVEEMETVGRFWGWVGRTRYAEPFFLRVPPLVPDSPSLAALMRLG